MTDPPINAELQYRLNLAQELIARLIDLEKPEALTAAYERAWAAARNGVIKFARESVRELGPLTVHAQDALFDKWSKNLQFTHEEAKTVA